MAADITLADSATDTANSSSYTFSGLSLGSTAADRHIVVCFECRGLGTTETVTGVTVGGESATVIVTARDDDTNYHLACVAIVELPTGTSADVVVTLSSGALRAACQVYRLTGIDASEHDTGTGTSGTTSASADLDVPDGGVVVGCAVCGHASSGNADVTWSGLTEDVDVQVETFVDFSSGSHGPATSTETPRSITATQNGTGTRNAVATVSWPEASGDVTASLDATQAGQTTAAIGTVTVVGAATITQASDTISAAGTVSIVADVAATGAGDSVAAVAAVGVVASVSGSQVGDTASATGTVSVGASLAGTQDDHALSSTTLVAVLAAVGATQAGNTLTSTGAIGDVVVASLDATQAGQTTTATASVAVVGTVAATLDSDSIAAAGVVDVVAQAVIVAEGDTLAVSTGITVVANASLIQVGDTLTAQAGSGLSAETPDGVFRRHGDQIRIFQHPFAGRLFHRQNDQGRVFRGGPVR